uniref:Uncharacterized protein n=1 Tax=Anguilla anguilla TaxID=7936 RepID=A0A0E9QM16_ANGAN
MLEDFDEKKLSFCISNGNNV